MPVRARARAPSCDMFARCSESRTSASRFPEREKDNPDAHVTRFFFFNARCAEYRDAGKRDRYCRDSGAQARMRNYDH